MTSSGFQSFTTPRDTFVSQSTQPAINTQDGLSQIAQTLSVIEPTLQKYIVNIMPKKNIYSLNLLKKVITFEKSLIIFFLLQLKF